MVLAVLAKAVIQVPLQELDQDLAQVQPVNLVIPLVATAADLAGDPVMLAMGPATDQTMNLPVDLRVDRTRTTSAFMSTEGWLFLVKASEA